ncbi:MAG TPA: ADP-polyphosphate phosphotransferase [Opitutaceae bacterium]
MKIDLKQFRVRSGHKVHLKKWATRTKRLYKSEKHYKEILACDVGDLSDLQHRLYASDSVAVLLIFQALDAAGKDGAISHVLTGINPAGCEVSSFKTPSAEEADHDFLWRTTCRLPGRGRIGVFNRSYYEEVLVVRVHPELLRGEGVTGAIAPKRDLWERRFESIVDLERHLHRNGTVIIKFYLHLSKGEQRRRFLERIDEPEKNWKFSVADMKERQFWGKYMTAYGECLGATSTRDSPWHVIPADDKLNARLIVSRIVIETMKGLKLAYPEVTRRRSKELLAIRRQLTK